MNWLSCCAILFVSTAYAAIDVEKTVIRVQNILQENSQLPRLTRDEILQLLRDIRAEDAKSTTRHKETTTAKVKLSDYLDNKDSDNRNNVTDINENIVIVDKQQYISAKPHKPQQVESTTKKTTPTLTVVLPYTPRDGSSLQELYTRPPRVEVVPVPKNVKKSDIRETLNKNSRLATKAKKTSLSVDLEQFLNDHGIKNKPGQDTFLLPLDGFKPLPTAKSTQDSLDLPENILLTYDLIPQEQKNQHSLKQMPPINVLYEPLKPEFPFELDESASEVEKSVLPLDLPKSRRTKSSEPIPEKPSEPVDYYSIKVIPLNQGPLPGDADEKDNVIFDVNKRQTDNSSTATADTTENPTVETTVAADGDTKLASTNDVPASDSGASITDLEDSFGGASPAEPGDSELPPPKKNGFYWMLDWNSFLEVGDGDTKVNIRFEPKLGDPQMFLPVNVP